MSRIAVARRGLRINSSLRMALEFSGEREMDNRSLSSTYGQHRNDAFILSNDTIFRCESGGGMECRNQGVLSSGVLWVLWF